MDADSEMVMKVQMQAKDGEQNRTVAELLTEASTGRSATCCTTPDSIAESNLPRCGNLVVTTGAALAVLAGERWLSEEGLDKDDVVSFHDGTY